jgi:hypothetical protein
MTRAELLALIARVERATQADRDLDADVAWLIHDGRAKREADGQREVWHKGLTPPRWVHWTSCSTFWPHYTLSIDAALKLIPAGYRWMAAGADQLVKRPSAMVIREGLSVSEGTGMVWGATPALAIAAAALRARLDEIEA